MISIEKPDFEKAQNEATRLLLIQKIDDLRIDVNYRKIRVTFS